MVILILKCLEFFLTCGSVFRVHSAVHGGESCPIRGWRLVAPTELCSSDPDDVEFYHGVLLSACKPSPTHPTHSFLNSRLEAAVDKPFPSSFPISSPAAQQNCSSSRFAGPCSCGEQEGLPHVVHGLGLRPLVKRSGKEVTSAAIPPHPRPTSVRATAALREQKHMTETEGSRRLSNRVRTYLLCVELT